MKITVIGAAGRAGRQIVSEALSRDHEVTGVVRDAAQFSKLPCGVIKRQGDLMDQADVIRVSRGQDVVVSAVRPLPGRPEELNAGMQALMDGLAETATRLLVIGGAARLRVPGKSGLTVLEDPGFLTPSARPIGQASLYQYRWCTAEQRVDWVYLSPAAQLVEGERRGTYRCGRDELLVDHAGISRITYPDLAVAALDELEAPCHHRQAFTVAY